MDVYKLSQMTLKKTFSFAIALLLSFLKNIVPHTTERGTDIPSWTCFQIKSPESSMCNNNNIFIAATLYGFGTSLTYLFLFSLKYQKGRL